MGFFQKIFKKKTEDESDWDKVQGEKDELDLNDPYVREQYVISCLEQMREASLEIDRINDEYAQVTSYLTDMEEIESLPPEDKGELEEIARHLHDLRKAHDKYVLTPSSMTEREYTHIDSLYDEVEDGIKKLEEEEVYKGKVKSDLRRVSREREAYSMRKRELRKSIENMRGTAIISLWAAGILVVILFLLQLFLDIDVSLGYYLAIAVVAIAITVIYLKYADYVAEKSRVDSTINELILLENKVKIRYVNNKNLLDYLYTKFEVKSAAELKDLFSRFEKEKADRRAFEKNEATYEDELSRLVRKLRNQRVKDPEIWIHQSDAIYDSREMVEIRHSLIGRRQKLRKQLEYNEQIAIEAGDEIKEIIRDYPKDADSLMNLVNKYDQMKTGDM